MLLLIKVKELDVCGSLVLSSSVTYRVEIYTIMFAMNMELSTGYVFLCISFFTTYKSKISEE